MELNVPIFDVCETMVFYASTASNYTMANEYRGHHLTLLSEFVMKSNGHSYMLRVVECQEL